jgi:hypothetical protein
LLWLLLEESLDWMLLFEVELEAEQTSEEELDTEDEDLEDVVISSSGFGAFTGHGLTELGSEDDEDTKLPISVGEGEGDGLSFASSVAGGGHKRRGRRGLIVEDDIEYGGLDFGLDGGLDGGFDCEHLDGELSVTGSVSVVGVLTLPLVLFLGKDSEDGKGDAAGVIFSGPCVVTLTRNKRGLSGGDSATMIFDDDFIYRDCSSSSNWT